MDHIRCPPNCFNFNIGNWRLNHLFKQGGSFWRMCRMPNWNSLFSFDDVCTSMVGKRKETRTPTILEWPTTKWLQQKDSSISSTPKWRANSTSVVSRREKCSANPLDQKLWLPNCLDFPIPNYHALLLLFKHWPHNIHMCCIRHDNVQHYNNMSSVSTNSNWLRKESSNPPFQSTWHGPSTSV